MSDKTRGFRSMREQFETGKPLYGWYVTFQIADIVELVGKYWDWIWIDLQHSPIAAVEGIEGLMFRPDDYVREKG